MWTQNNLHSAFIINRRMFPGVKKEDFLKIVLL